MYIIAGLSALALAVALIVDIVYPNHQGIEPIVGMLVGRWMQPEQVTSPTSTPGAEPERNVGATTPLSPVPTLAAAITTVAPAATAPTLTPTPLSVVTVAGQQDAFFDPQRFSYEPGFYEPEIQAFLDAQPGPLKEVRFQIGDRSQSFATVLVGFSNLYSFNPKILLALMEQQGQLLSTAEPSADQLTWAMGFRGEGERHSGLYAQFRWSAFALRQAVRDYALGKPANALPDLVFADDTRQPVPPNIGMVRYALARVLARTTTPEALPDKLNTFLAIYTRLFGDPRQPPTGWPPLAAPFLTSPMERPTRVTSFFDHDSPFLQQNGSLVSFWGTIEVALSYDGHTGWDYALRPPDAVLAAAPGVVVFAGNSDDGCGIPAVAAIIEHGNGYRTLYWHLSDVSVEAGQRVQAGTEVGIAGATGCAFGPHLHFQVQYLGRDVDPYGWCGVVPDPWANNPAGQQSVWLWADMPSPCSPPPGDTIVVDDQSPGFARQGDWQQSPLGYAGGALFTSTNYVSAEYQPWEIRPLANTPAVAVWQPELPRAGTYRVLAYIPYVLNGLDDSQELRYRVAHSSGETEVVVDGEATANFWADLGTYTFDPQENALVSLSSLAGDEARGIWADAVAWIPVR